MPENYETWHGVMKWHQHAVVKKLQNRNKFWYKLQTGASLKKARASERERVTSVCETTYTAFFRLNFFYTGRLDQIEVLC